jgi:hypothetical protein
MADADTGYVQRLSYVLRKRDVDALREFLKQEAVVREPERALEIESIPNHELETRMHKMILARPDLGDLHADARRWLRENTAPIGLEWG